MTATEVLHRMLDERGVEHDSGEVSDQIWWKDSTGRVYFAKGEETLMFFNFTPEQAVDATLGRGTCHNLKASWPSLFECDECGYSNDDTYCGSECHFKFCPNCGAKVVDA